MPLTLKAVNDELAKRGYTARLAKAAGYFYFHSGEADDWPDRTLTVATLNALTLPQWMAEFERLAKANAEIMRERKSKGKAAQ